MTPAVARAASLVAAVALVAAACGVRNRPLPPELVQPEPPTSLVAKSAADGVRLTWRRPMKYSGGGRMRDLAGFDVERADGADGLAFATVGFAEVTDRTRFRPDRTTTWTDASAVAGATYRYRIVATTLDRYRSAPSESVTITHRPGAAPPPAPTPPTPKPPTSRSGG